jgi:two-component system nitrate/nitrite response regulator NarL
MDNPMNHPLPVRILVVDDHTLFRRGLIALLTRDERLTVVAEAGDAGEALRAAQAHQPDVILLDNHLPGVHGVAALPQLCAAAPAARIVMLTVSEDADDLAQALARGAAGYLLKTIEGDELAEAIMRVLAGESVVSPEMTSKLIAAYRHAVASPAGEGFVVPGEPAAELQPEPTPQPQSPGDAALSRLSPREHDILREIARGASNKEIARSLGIAETTVKIHVQHILRKLNLTSRVQAAVFATARGGAGAAD